MSKDKSAEFNRGFNTGYARGLDDYGDDRTDVPDVRRLSVLEAEHCSFGYNVELGAWGMEYESPWFPTLRELADWLIRQEATKAVMT